MEIKLTTLHNPYLEKISFLDIGIFKKIFRHIVIDKVNLFYFSMNESIKNECDTKYIKNLDKCIHKLNGNDCEIVYKNHENKDPCFDESQLTDFEIVHCNDFINSIKNKIINILEIKNAFVNEVFNIECKKLKTAHFGSEISPREHNTTFTDLNNFIKYSNDDYSKRCILSNYDELLKKHKITLKNKINKSELPRCFFLWKIYELFQKYVDSLLYILLLLKEKPYMIRYNDMHNILNDEYFLMYDENNESGTTIKIKHLNTLDIKCKKNGNVINGDNFKYIKIKITNNSKQNTVYFCES